MRHILIFIIFLVSIDTCAQSGWTKPKGEGLFLLNYRYFASDSYYTLGGDELETSEFQQNSILFYGEYGITDKFTIIVNFPVYGTNTFETTETVGGIGDLQLELKYALPTGNIPVSFALAPVFPTGQADNFAQSELNSFDRINLPIGDGEFNLWSILAASSSLKSTPLYGTLYGAYNLRTSYNDNSFSDQVLVGGEIGYRILKDTWINAKISALTSIENVETINDFVRSDGTEYTSYSLGLIFPLVKNFQGIAAYQNFNDLIFERKNIYSAGAYSLGVMYNFKPNAQ